MTLKPRMTILFQGDSVTDAGRRTDSICLGSGYVKFVVNILKAKYPDYELKFVNRGISGNRSISLVERWQADCIDLKPDIVTILIGVNDTWRNFDRDLYTSPEEYYANMEKLVSDTQSAGAQVILLEPFIMRTGHPAKNWYAWSSDIDAKIVRLREIARKYNTGYIPLMSLFAMETLTADPEKYTADGVHPNTEGHRYIASRVIEALER